MIYLATPYNHVDAAVVKYRRETFFEIDLRMAEEGLHTVSPIYKSLIAEKISRKVDLSYQAWEDYCIELMKLCDEVYVIMFEDWEQSHGVSEEIKLANQLGKHVVYIDPNLYLRFHT